MITHKNTGKIVSLLMALGLLLGLTATGCTDKDRDINGIIDADYAIYVCPEGYSVNEDHTAILDAEGNEVAAADLPAAQDIAAGEDHTFVVIGAATVNDETAYAMVDEGVVTELEVATQEGLIAAEGLTVSVDAEAVPEETAATLTAYVTVDETEYSASIDINVTGEIVGGLILTADPEEIAVDETSQLTAMYGDGDVTADCTFESNDDTIATVDEAGLVTGVAEGVVTITATYQAEGEEEPATATVDITVGAAGDQLEATIEPEQIAVGEEAQITATYGVDEAGEPVDVTADCTFESGDVEVATVDEAGVVTGVAEGEATITVEYTPEGAEEALQTEVTITVAAAGDVLEATIEPEEIAAEETAQITATYGVDEETGDPIDVTADCTFESSDEAIATVDEAGLVTGVAEGEATITVTYTVDGEDQTADVTITVTPAAADLEVAVEEDQIAVAQETQITATYGVDEQGAPVDVTDDCTFESSDEAIATVTAAGVVTGVAEGDVTITVKYTPEGGEEIEKTVDIHVAA